MNNTNVNVKDILEHFASQLERAPAHIVGAKVSVTAGAGGSVTGLIVEANAGPAGTSAVGMHVIVDAGKYQRDLAELVSDIRDAAKAAESENPPKGWIKILLQKASGLPNEAIKGIIGGAAFELAKVYGPF